MRLIVVLAVFLVVFIALTTGAVVSARAQTPANSLSSLGLGMCTDTPCLLGIVPAVTYWSDAATHLLDLYSIKYEQEQSILVGEQGEDRIYIYPDSDQRVRRVIYTPYAAKPNTGDLLRLFGMPCNFLIETSTYASLTYPHMQVYVSFVQGRVSMYSPVLTVILFDTDRTVLCYPERWRSWAGFKHRFSYMSRWPRCFDCVGSAR